MVTLRVKISSLDISTSFKIFAAVAPQPFFLQSHLLKRTRRGSFSFISQNLCHILFLLLLFLQIFLCKRSGYDQISYCLVVLNSMS